MAAVSACDHGRDADRYCAICELDALRVRVETAEQRVVLLEADVRTAQKHAKFARGQRDEEHKLRVQAERERDFDKRRADGYWDDLAAARERIGELEKQARYYEEAGIEAQRERDTARREAEGLRAKLTSAESRAVNNGIVMLRMEDERDRERTRAERLEAFVRDEVIRLLPDTEIARRAREALGED